MQMCPQARNQLHNSGTRLLTVHGRNCFAAVLLLTVHGRNCFEPPAFSSLAWFKLLLHRCCPGLLRAAHSVCVRACVCVCVCACVRSTGKPQSAARPAASTAAAPAAAAGPSEPEDPKAAAEKALRNLKKKVCKPDALGT